MRTTKSKTESQKLAGSIQLARLRVEEAEKRWKAAREQASRAKRRRKEVKLLARRAKKLAKQAKADLAGARKVLAEAEARLATVTARPRTRKPAGHKARSVARVTTTLTEPATTSSQPRPLSIAPSDALEIIPVTAAAPADSSTTASATA